MDIIDSINSNQEFWYSPSYGQRSQPSFHGAIFSNAEREEGFSREATLGVSRSNLDEKVEGLFLESFDEKMMITKSKAGGSVEVGGRIEWGSKDEPTYSSYATFEGHDRHGNSAEVTGE